ncbi:46474_t:CDS:2, partial [Gigaspora margarita]
IHYGVFSRDWWTTIEKDSNNQATMLCPIRIGMKMLVELNGHEFFINVLEPNIEDSRQLFGTKTKFSGPLVMGFNQSDIVKQLLEDINFQPFEFYLDQLRIVVFGIGVSKNQDWNYVGTRYQSLLVNNIGKKCFLY